MQAVIFIIFLFLLSQVIGRCEQQQQQWQPMVVVLVVTGEYRYKQDGLATSRGRLVLDDGFLSSQFSPICYVP
jgi:hypothetical protein